MELFVGGLVVDELEVDDRVVGGSTVEELEVDGRVASVEAGRVASVEAGRVAKGVGVVELFVGGCISVVPSINSIISSQKSSLVIEMLTNYDIK